MDVYDSLKYKTTLGFNEYQYLHKNTICKEHPECPDRIEICRSVLQQSGLLDECQEVDEFPSLDDSDLRQSHAEDYVNKLVKEAILMDQESLNHFCEDYDSVFMTTASVKAAQSAVSCCRWLAEGIVANKIPNAFALIRPPGHHANRYSASGFCLFNNAAQAAEAAFDFGADRILIVDLDIHHGNGTQQIFYEDKRILVFSIHRYENGKFWPHLRESDYDHIGNAGGKGYNVNIPLNEVGCGDADYMAIFWNVLWPLTIQFKPDFVIVSAGFDSCDGDPLGEMRLSPDAYAHIIYHLSAAAHGKLLMILEGGYNHSALSVGVHRCVRVLCGYKPVAIKISHPPKTSTVESCLNTISVLRNFWTCFDFYLWNDVPWISHYPTNIFVPPKKEDVRRTSALSQEDLPHFDWKYPSSTLTKTLIIYNSKTEKHVSSSDADHLERPERITRILKELEECDLIFQCEVIKSRRLATEAELEAVHERPYVQKIKRTVEMSDNELRITEDGLNSVFLTRNTFATARLAAGSVLECVDRVMAVAPGELNAFAVIRPPGHHAGISDPSGFCIFNNVAVAAKYAIAKYNIQRVLIMDWDIHHGNGTQEIFYEDNKVLYMSIHRHDDGNFYPMGASKDYTDVGEGAGRGYSVNLPWNYAKVGDEAYRAGFSKVVMPIAYEFNPELVFISAGFDAAAGDPLGECMVSPDTFALMTYQLIALAGRTIAVLEGGYNLSAMAKCVAAVCKVMVYGGVRKAVKSYETSGRRLSRHVWDSIRNVATVHEQYWSCLRGFQKHFKSKMSRKQKTAQNAQLSNTDMRSTRSSPRTAAVEDVDEQLEVMRL